MIGMVAVMGFSCMKTEWKCVSNQCALCSGMVTGCVVIFQCSYANGVLYARLEELTEVSLDVSLRCL